MRGRGAVMAVSEQVGNAVVIGQIALLRKALHVRTASPVTGLTGGQSLIPTVQGTVSVLVLSLRVQTTV